MSKVLDFPMEEEAFLDLQGYAGFGEAPKYFVYMGDMFLNRLRIEYNIVYVEDTCLPVVFFEYKIQKKLEQRWGFA